MTKDDDNEPYSIFSTRQKVTIVAITVISTAMLTALPINIYYPALNTIKQVSVISDQVVMNPILTIRIYI